MKQNNSDNPEDLLNGHLYKLVGKKAIACSLEEYITAMKSPSNRIIEQKQIGELLVSTVFTGIDRSFGQNDKQLFEVSVFGLSDEIQPCWRFGTYNSALREHRRIVLLLETKGKDALLDEIHNNINN